MKKAFTFLLVLVLVQATIAQEEEIKEQDKMNTVFTKENLKLTGGYLSPEIKVSNIHEDISLLLGGKMGFTFNDNFSLGLAAFGVTSNSNFDIPSIDPISSGITPVRIGLIYGGLSFEYTIFSDQLVHFTIPVIAGAAGVFLYEDQDEFTYDNYNEIENSAAFVIEPGINVEVNLFKFFRVDLGASYRLLEGTDLQYLTDENLSGLSMNLAFKFGFF